MRRPARHSGEQAPGAMSVGGHERNPSTVGEARQPADEGAPPPLPGVSYDISLPGCPAEEKFQVSVVSAADDFVVVGLDSGQKRELNRAWWEKKAFVYAPPPLTRELRELRAALNEGELSEEQHRRKAKEAKEVFYSSEPRYAVDGCSACSAFDLALREEQHRVLAERRQRAKQQLKSACAALRATGRFGLPVGSAARAAAGIGHDRGPTPNSSVGVGGTFTTRCLPSSAPGSAAPSPAPDAASPSGPKVVRRQWGEIRKSKLLGKGAFGTVWLGLREDTGGFVAMKEMSLAAAQEEGGMAQVEAIAREIKTMKPLKHRNIVRFLHAERTQLHGEPGLRIFMEYVPGGSLSGVMESFVRPGGGADAASPTGTGLSGPRRGLAEATVKSYTRQMLEGLEYLHGSGVVHRDIKGENALVGADGTVKVADFGTSVKIDQCSRETCGTPGFMAPEVVRAPEDGTGHDGKADIWSVGATVVQLITGRAPWSHLDKYAAMFAVARGDPDDPPDKYLLEEDVSGDCRDFVRLCFERDRRLRPTATELLKHPWLADAPDLGDDPGGPLTAGAPQRPPAAAGAPAAGPGPGTDPRRPLGAPADWTEKMPRRPQRPQAQAAAAAQQSFNEAQPLPAPAGRRGSGTYPGRADSGASLGKRDSTGGHNPCTISSAEGAAWGANANSSWNAKEEMKRGFISDFEAEAKAALAYG